MGELTSEEMERLRVRLADLPGFNPVGLTVDAKNGDGSTFGAALCVGVRHPQGGTVFWMWTEVNGLVVFGHGTEVFVSTADARTRDALARWVAGRYGLRVGSSCPSLLCNEQELFQWKLYSAPDFRVYNSGHVTFDGDAEDGPTELRRLRAEDPRLLPGLTANDRARWVDAAALAAVARFVGSRR